MINRQVIRTRVLQIAYAHLHKGEQKISASEADLRTSLERSYDLYMYLLRLPVELTERIVELQATRLRKHFRSEEAHLTNGRLADNLYVAQVERCQPLELWYNQFPLNWLDADLLLRSLVDAIESSQLYLDYLASEPSYEADRNFWVQAFAQIIAPSAELAEYLEEQSIYWDDELCYIEKIDCENHPGLDSEEIQAAVQSAQEQELYQSQRYENGNVEIVKAFVLKSMKRATAEEELESVLLPAYRDEEDETFALHLLRQTLVGYDKAGELIRRHLSAGWDKERLADMDELLMHLAVTEFLHFPAIPTNITINEYVELSKHYSTPKSSAFVNGVLDSIAKELKAEGKILKK
ncbi:MAG: transcription antitermination factor NusB [Porphyromonas sp.]|nr:transcription antitermination factor NusB [Porphyromonas sp.]